jgi:peptidoglycan hydrolase-like protein with peptidoglycan-binding domain
MRTKSPEDDSERPRRYRRRWVAVAVGVVVAGGAATTYLLVTGPEPHAAGRPAVAQATARVTRTTLTETVDVDGSLDHGRPAQVVNRLAGTITSTAAVGATVSRGQSLYAVDQRPVVLFYGAVPAYRPLLAGLTGDDVGQLEQNLRAVGYTGFTVDETFSDATARAVLRWQHDLGLVENGVVELGRVVFLADAVRVGEVLTGPGTAARPDQPALSYTGTTMTATVPLDADQRPMAVPGAEVTVTLPGNARVTATVAGVAAAPAPADQSEPGAAQQPDAAAAAFTATLTVADQRALTGLDGAAVTVALVGQRRDDVLAAPVAALLALREGGYGVQVVTGSATTIVPVVTGLFANGLVEISGPDVAEGVEVGVPAP